jgi:hypothetical protein
VNAQFANPFADWPHVTWVAHRKTIDSGGDFGSPAYVSKTGDPFGEFGSLTNFDHGV